jgi:hypothetical protein
MAEEKLDPIEVFRRDISAHKAAVAMLTPLTAGIQDGRLGYYAPDLVRIKGYFEKIPSLQVDIGRMFRTLALAPEIDGMLCNVFHARLTIVKQEIMRRRPFMGRKKKIACFFPKEHKQPCYCARSAAAKALTASLEAEREETERQFNGILAVPEREIV